MRLHDPIFDHESRHSTSSRCSQRCLRIRKVITLRASNRYRSLPFSHCQNMRPRNVSSRSRLSISHGAFMLLIAIGVAGWSSAGFAASGSRGAPSPSPTPSPPAIEFLAVPNHEILNRTEQAEVSVLISNKSDKPVQVLDVSLAGKNTTGQDAH